MPLLIIVVGIAWRYFSLWCTYTTGYCYNSLVHDLFDFTNPVYTYSLVALPTGIVLIFVQSQTFSSWLRFAKWWIIFSAVIIAMSPAHVGGWFPLYSFNKNDAAWFLGILFTLISLTIIGVKLIQLRKG